MSEIYIKALKTMSEMDKVCELQAAIWGRDYVIPAVKLFVDADSDGIVIGAFAADGKMLGFTYSSAMCKQGLMYQYSNVEAVVEEYRGAKIGEMIKNAQRKEALRLGYNLITWTYDPLESVNANLNIGKMGAICASYRVNFYGGIADSLNVGMPTDRLQVCWYLNKPANKRQYATKIIVLAAIDGGEFPKPQTILSKIKSTDSTAAIVSIPAAFQAMKQFDMDLAIKWRLACREAFLMLLDKGFVLTGFQSNGREAKNHDYIFTPLCDLSYQPQRWC